VPPPLDPAKRAAIAEDIKAGKKRNEIARIHGVGAGTVTRIAQLEGLSFDRSETENATRAVQLDNKARRTALAARLLNKAAELLDLMDEPYLVHSFGGRDNSYNEQLLDRAPASDLRNLMTSAAVAIDKHAVLEKLDVDSGAASAKSMLGELGAALQVAADHMNGTTEGGEG
jgi:transposase-like protein